MNIPAFMNTLQIRVRSLPIVIIYVTEACNLKCITCSYRDPLPGELTLDEYRVLAQELNTLGLRHVVYSGGEPLLRKDLPAICKIFEHHHVHQSLLTNGLLLEKRIHEVGPFLRELIVSIDGPDRETHNRIRGLECFDQIIRGVTRALSIPGRPLISVRFVVQKHNYRKLGKMVSFARELGVDHLSFLAVDGHSSAFQRNPGVSTQTKDILLSSDECREFRSIIEELSRDHFAEFKSGFISETPAKMAHIASYFEAAQNDGMFPINTCNAPMVSTVITSTGELLPCYFLGSYGNIRTNPLRDVLNSPGIRRTRKNVRDYVLDECRRCVCTLHVSPVKALTDAF